MTGDALASLREIDRERWLAMLWAPAPLRLGAAAILAVDLELERVVAEVREPLAAELRLAWWREELARIAAGAPPPAEPRLAALAREVRPRGVDLVALSGIEDALLALLADGSADLAAVAAARGACLARALCALLGEAPSPAAEAAGARISFARFARRPWGPRRALVSAGLARWRAGAPAPFETSGRALPGLLAGLDAIARQDLARLRRGRALAPSANLTRQIMIAAASHGLSFGRGD